MVCLAGGDVLAFAAKHKRSISMMDLYDDACHRDARASSLMGQSRGSSAPIRSAPRTDGFPTRPPQVGDGRPRHHGPPHHLPIDGPSCSEMYRSAETSSFARDDVVGRRRGAASGVRGGRTWYARAAAGRNRGDESGVRLAYHVRAPRGASRAWAIGSGSSPARVTTSRTTPPPRCQPCRPPTPERVDGRRSA